MTEGAQPTRVIPIVLSMLTFSVGPIAAQEVLEGTLQLVSSKRTNTTTGATTDSFGPNPLGYVMYSNGLECEGCASVLNCCDAKPRNPTINGCSEFKAVCT